MKFGELRLDFLLIFENVSRNPTSTPLAHAILINTVIRNIRGQGVNPGFGIVAVSRRFRVSILVVVGGEVNGALGAAAGDAHASREALTGAGGWVFWRAIPRHVFF